MNRWDITLKRFRDLGGVAENVELREGIYGRGLFAIDSKKPVKISIPNHLLMPVEWLLLDAQGNLILSEQCDWTEEAKGFYLDYQRDYGVGGNLMQEIMSWQTKLLDLPESLKAMLISYGVGDSFFEKPTLQTCMNRYKYSRRISIGGERLVLMPIVELINHEEDSEKSFIIAPQVGISGNFLDEILVNYGMSGDAALMFEAYGFSTPKPYTFSGSLGINLGPKAIKIARYVTLYKTIANTNVPMLKVEGNTIHLSCLVLGSVNDKNSPKKVFTKLMQTVGMPANIASNVFDGIVDQNRSFFLHLLEELKPLDGAVIEGLRTMAKHQLIPLGARV